MYMRRTEMYNCLEQEKGCVGLGCRSGKDSIGSVLHWSQNLCCGCVRAGVDE